MADARKNPRLAVESILPQWRCANLASAAPGTVGAAVIPALAELDSLAL